MATCRCLAGSAKDFYTWTNWTGPVPVPRPAQIGSSVLFPNPSVLLSVFRLRHRPPRSPRHPPDVPAVLNLRIVFHRRPDAVHPTTPTRLAPPEEGHRGGVLDRPRRAHALPAAQHSSRSSSCLCLTCSRPYCVPPGIVSGDRGSKSSRLMHICGVPPLEPTVQIVKVRPGRLLAVSRCSYADPGGPREGTISLGGMSTWTPCSSFPVHIDLERLTSVSMSSRSVAT